MRQDIIQDTRYVHDTRYKIRMYKIRTYKIQDILLLLVCIMPVSIPHTYVQIAEVVTEKAVRVRTRIVWPRLRGSIDVVLSTATTLQRTEPLKSSGHVRSSSLSYTASQCGEWNVDDRQRLDAFGRFTAEQHYVRRTWHNSALFLHTHTHTKSNTTTSIHIYDDVIHQQHALCSLRAKRCCTYSK